MVVDMIVLCLCQFDMIEFEWSYLTMHCTCRSD